jgi:hypothetical protein
MNQVDQFRTAKLMEQEVCEGDSACARPVTIIRKHGYRLSFFCVYHGA